MKVNNIFHTSMMNCYSVEKYIVWITEFQIYLLILILNMHALTLSCVNFHGVSPTLDFHIFHTVPYPQS